MKYDLKKRIKIFYITTERDSEGFIVNVKRYIHPVDQFLCASYQNLKTDQILANKQYQNDTSAYFYVNRRVIEKDMYVEYNRRTFGTCLYQIVGVDPFDDTSNLLKLSVKQINQKLIFDKVEGSEL